MIPQLLHNCGDTHVRRNENELMKLLNLTPVSEVNFPLKFDMNAPLKKLT